MCIYVLGGKNKEKILKKKGKKPWKHAYMCPRLQRKKKKEKQSNPANMCMDVLGVQREKQNKKKEKKPQKHAYACPGVQRKKKTKKKENKPWKHTYVCPRGAKWAVCVVGVKTHSGGGCGWWKCMVGLWVGARWSKHVMEGCG